MSEIRVFHTHIEVYPYEKGECPELERSLSKFDTVAHTRIPIGYYISNDILYLPRGVNTSRLQEWFHNTPIPVTKYNPCAKIKKGTPLNKPKSNIQDEAIQFLTGTGSFAYSARYSQLGLNLDTGDGKTYATIYAILKMKYKAIIITHQEKLKEQWISTFRDMTTFPMENICNIEGTEVMDEIMKGKINAEIYFVNHQTISSYARIHGWSSIRDFFLKIKVGIKVIDEAHKFFENTLMIDFFSNVYKSFYLTATFGRSDQGEIGIYKRSFSSIARYGEQTINYEEKRKHIIFIVVYFNSHPEYGILPSVSTGYGFSSYKYIDYELQEENKSLMKVVHRIMDETQKLEGKTLILSPKTDSVESIARDIKEEYGYDVGTIYSKNKPDVNTSNKQKDVICSTIKSVGEGADIKGLRVLINLEPVGSKSLADQMRGRLREYSETEDTYLFYPVDMMVPETYKFLKRILPTMKKKCKEIIFMKMEDI